MCLIILTLTIRVFVFTWKELLETVDEQADTTTEVSEVASQPVKPPVDVTPAEVPSNKVQEI